MEIEKEKGKGKRNKKGSEMNENQEIEKEM